MTDVPTDCLDAFIYGTEKGVPVTIYFDAEGYRYYVVVNEFICYVIKEAGEDEYTDTLYRIGINREELAKELINDIESYFEDWVRWESYKDFDEKELEIVRESLEMRLDYLKALVRQFGDV